MLPDRIEWRRAYMKRYVANRREQFKALGLCPLCGGERKDEAYVACRPCRLKRSTFHQSVVNSVASATGHVQSSSGSIA